MDLNKLLKYPACITVIPVGLGILFSYFFIQNFLSLSYTSFIGVLILSLLSSIYFYSQLQKLKLYSFIVFGLSLFLFGFMYFQFSNNYREANNVSNHILSYKNESVTLYGKVVELPSFREQSIRLIIDSDSIKARDSVINIEGMIIGSVYKSKFGSLSGSNLTYGDVISIEGELESLPRQHNPGEFDYGKYLKMHGIDAAFKSFGFEKIKIIGKADVSWFKKFVIYPVKEYSINTIDSLVGGQEGEFLKGLVLGERSNIANDVKTDFVNAGVSHIIAVSGLNVAYVIIIISFVLMLLPIRYNFKIVILILCLLFYMQLTGSTASIVRATIMAIVFYLAGPLERKQNPYNTVAFSAVIILLWDPRQLFDGGFILSYSALLSIIIFYPLLDNRLKNFKFYLALESDKWYLKFTKMAVALFLGTLAAQIGTMPIIAIMFKKISIVSFVTNLVAIPASNVALAIGFIFIPISLISNWLAVTFALSAKVLLFWLLHFIHYLANFDWSFVETYGVDLSMFFIYYLIVIIIFRMKKESYIGKLVIVLLLAAGFITLKNYYDRNDSLRLTYMDVGNSNSCLLKFPKGNNILVNTGSASNNFSAAQRNVIPYIKSSGVNEIDLLIITSLNEREFRNLFYFLDGFTVKKIIIPDYYKTLLENSYFNNFYDKYNIEYIVESKVINQKGNFRIYLSYEKVTEKNPSMFVQVIYGKQSFIFSDIFNINEDLTYQNFIVDDSVSVMRLPGSGSYNFTSSEFIAKTNPEYLVISSQEKTKKNLHSDIFEQSLESNGYEVIKTGEEGAVIFETDGEKTWRVNWK